MGLRKRVAELEKTVAELQFKVNAVKEENENLRNAFNEINANAEIDRATRSEAANLLREYLTGEETNTEKDKRRQ